MATEALAAVEAALHAARPELKARLAGAAAALSEHHQLDAFYQTVTAAGACSQRPCSTKQLADLQDPDQALLDLCPRDLFLTSKRALASCIWQSCVHLARGQHALRVTLLSFDPASGPL